MSLTRRAGFIGKQAALWVGMAIAVLCLTLGAMGFFAAALLIWLSHALGPAAAAAITGAALLVLACVIALIFTLALRRMRARQPGMASEAMGALGLALRFATLLVRRDPRKAVLAALIAGAVAEYFSGDKGAKS